MQDSAADFRVIIPDNPIVAKEQAYREGYQDGFRDGLKAMTHPAFARRFDSYLTWRYRDGDWHVLAITETGGSG